MGNSHAAPGRAPSPLSPAPDQALLAAAFGLQLSPARQTLWIELAGCYCCEDSASWFMIMTAIAELACRGEFRDLGEEGVQSLAHVPKVQASDAGRIDDPPTGGHGMK